MQSPVTHLPSPPLDPSTLKADMSAKELSWLKYVRAHGLMPFIDSKGNSGTAAAGVDSLNPASPSHTTSPTRVGGLPATPSKSSSGKMMHYALVLNRITGMRIPPQAASEPRSNLRFRVCISFYDTWHKRFFGRTWVGPLLRGRGVESVGSSCQIPQQIVYFKSKTQNMNEYCAAVVEYVLCVVRQESRKADERVVDEDDEDGGSAKKRQSEMDEVVVSRYGIGWTLLNVFSRDVASLVDVCDPGVDLDSSSVVGSAAGDPSALAESALAAGQLSDSMLSGSQSLGQVAAAQSSKLKRKVQMKKIVVW